MQNLRRFLLALVVVLWLNQIVCCVRKEKKIFFLTQEFVILLVSKSQQKLFFLAFWSWFLFYKLKENPFHTLSFFFFISLFVPLNGNNAFLLVPLFLGLSLIKIGDCLFCLF